MIQLYQKYQVHLEDHLPPHKLDQVAYSAVNRADTLQRMGRYPVPPGSPQVRDSNRLNFGNARIYEVVVNSIQFSHLQGLGLEAVGEVCQVRECPFMT